jgi:Flp pilus assembly pilin Flp
MGHMWQRLVGDDSGQDLVEYALLTASLALVSVATWPLILPAIASAYRALDAKTQSISEPLLPGGGP